MVMVGGGNVVVGVSGWWVGAHYIYIRVCKPNWHNFRFVMIDINSKNAIWPFVKWIQIMASSPELPTQTVTMSPLQLKFGIEMQILVLPSVRWKNTL